MEFLTDAINSDAAKTFAETIRDANLSSWQLLVLILLVPIAWNCKGLYKIFANKYEMKRRYDLLDKKADNKLKILQEKRKSKKNRAIDN